MVGEGSASESQKQCLDDLKTTHNDKTPLQKKIAEILLSDLFCTKAQKRWKKAVRKTIDDIRIQKVAVKGINDQDMQNQKEDYGVTKL